MHCCGAELKSMVRGEEPSALGQGKVPYAKPPGVVTAVASLALDSDPVDAAELVATGVLESSPPNTLDVTSRATTMATTMRITLRTERHRCFRCCSAIACSRRTWRPCFWRSRLAVPIRGGKLVEAPGRGSSGQRCRMFPADTG